MAKTTPGYKLYLYQLLSRELGFGKQTLLPQFEEVLRADDIVPQDLECATVQELVEACPDFLKLTVFKKGRVYATVLRNDEWDQMLQEVEAKPAPTQNKQVAGKKTWKKKKSGKKSLKAVKPGKQRREREAAEVLEAAARAEEERLAAEAAEAERLAAEAAEAERLAAERAEAERVAAEAERQAKEQMPTAEAKSATQEPVPAEAELAADAVEPKGEASSPQAATPVEAPPTSVEPDGLVQAEAQPKPVEEAVSQAAPAPEPALEPKAQPKLAPMAPGPKPIKLTIAYNPYEDMERELERQRQEAASAPSPKPEPPRATQASQGMAKPIISLDDLPQDFGIEVSCTDALLRTLYQLLPYDIEPIAVLDEDWRTARSTSTLAGSRTRVTFPLRYLHEDGTPITATLRKTTKNSFGKQWTLTLIDGDDGTGETHLALGAESIPSIDEGAWGDLSSAPSADVSASPVRALTQQVVIGTWDAFLGALSALAAPERWNYPGEGVGKQSRYGILREYVASTFFRAVKQDRFATSADGGFAAYHTGLLTSLGDEIYACHERRKGDIPWKFVGFATAGSGELGARLTATMANMPEPVSYLSSLDDVVPDASRLVILDTEAILGRQLGRLPRAFLAERLASNARAAELLAERGADASASLTQLARAIKADANTYRRLRRALDDAVDQSLRSVRASYRLAAPVYDPADNRTKLMIPLCLVEDGVADCALVLDLQPSGAYRAGAILSLPRAYACARVVSREQPSWLDAQRVLAGK